MNNLKSITLDKITWYIVLLVAIVLGLKSLREPDLYWMFRTGEWMVDNMKVPTEDVFSFTNKGTPWISVKWLFELIAYGIAQSIGPEFILVLQSLVNVLMVILLGKIATSVYQSITGKELSSRSGLFYLLALVFLFALDFRLVGRPEMVSHLFTLLFLFLFTKYRNRQGNFIYWLIPLQILWVNLHEAYAIGIVLLLTYGFSAIVEQKLSPKLTAKDFKRLLFAFGGALLAVAVNPRGFYMFYHPYFLFKVVGSNHYTTELNSVFYKPDYFFSYKEPYIAIGIFVLALAGLFYMAWRSQNFKTFILNKPGLGITLSIFSFFYLGLTGHRNVVFPVIVIMPVLMALGEILISSGSAKPFLARLKKPILYLALLAGIGFYFSIVTNFHYKTFQNSDRYGLKIYAMKNPEGAARFALENGLRDKRCFSDYLTSSYFLWSLRPGFESYIDLRDLDIFGRDFFDEFARVTYFTNQFEKSDSTYHYEYVMLYRPQFPHLHKYLYHHPAWEMVYADPIAVVYVKNNKVNKAIIDRVAPIKNSESGLFYAAPQPKPTAVSYGLSKLFWPLYTGIGDTYDSNLIAAQFFRSIAAFDEADIRAQMALDGEQPYEAWYELGNIYLDISHYKKDHNARAQYINDAAGYYANGVKLDRSRSECYSGLGLCAFYSGQYAQAVTQLKKAIERDPDNPLARETIAECYAQLMKTHANLANQYIPLWFENLEEAYRINPENQQVILKLATGYCQQNQCEKARKYLKAFEPQPGMNQADIDYLNKCKKRCR